MRESIGSTFLYNMIFVFIIIVFGLITATLNYYKAYKVNTRILKAIEQNSGYNAKSIEEINRVLSGIGYTTENNTIQTDICDESKNGGTLITSASIGKDTNYPYCVYYYENENGKNEKDKKNKDGDSLYYAYGVTTYIYIDLPIIGQFKVPVFSKGERIYRFSSERG